MRPIVLKPNKIKIFLYVLLDIAFILLSISILFFFEFPEFQTNNKYLVGIFGISFFGFGLVILLYKLFSSKPAIVIDNQGISMSEALLTTEDVAWEDITEFSTMQIHDQEFISVVVKDPEKYIPNNSKLRKKIYELNESGENYAAHIPTSYLKDMSTEGLLDILNQQLAIRKKNDQGL